MLSTPQLFLLFLRTLMNGLELNKATSASQNSNVFKLCEQQELFISQPQSNTPSLTLRSSTLWMCSLVFSQIRNEDPVKLSGALSLLSVFLSGELLCKFSHVTLLNSDLSSVQQGCHAPLGPTPYATDRVIPPGGMGELVISYRICFLSLRDCNLGLPVNERLQNFVSYILSSFLLNGVKMSLYHLICHGWKWNINCVILFYAFLYYLLLSVPHPTFIQMFSFEVIYYYF